jgi:hypothetical protein
MEFAGGFTGCACEYLFTAAKPRPDGLPGDIAINPHISSPYCESFTGNNMEGRKAFARKSRQVLSSIGIPAKKEGQKASPRAGEFRKNPVKPCKPGLGHKFPQLKETNGLIGRR